MDIPVFGFFRVLTKIAPLGKNNFDRGIFTSSDEEPHRPPLTRGGLRPSLSLSLSFSLSLIARAFGPRRAGPGHLENGTCHFHC